ncbi:hypothetical protein L9F63_018678, partial [Diploptera punctata]
DYNDEIRQEQMREMQLLNTTVLGVPGTSTDHVTPTSPAQSPTTSPPSTSTSKTNNGSTSSTSQNGRHVQMATAIPYAQQNGRSYICNQQFLLHPAFRGLTARAHGIQLPGVPPVFHAAGGGSILNRLRLHQHLATPALNAANNRLSPGAVISSAKHPRNNILSILAGGPRSVNLTTEAGGGNEPLLATMCGATEEVMVPAGEEEDAARASSVYGLYENYAAAAVAAAATNSGNDMSIERYRLSKLTRQPRWSDFSDACCSLLTAHRRSKEKYAIPIVFFLLNSNMISVFLHHARIAQRLKPYASFNKLITSVMFQIYMSAYGLIESYANGSGVLAPESLEDIAVPQDTVNGS